MFEAPIPGESLTKPPKNYPWERPPEMVDPEEILMFYLDRIMKPDTMEPMMDALEIGMTVRDLTSGLLRVGVSEGIHTVDASLLVAPAIHHAIKSTADRLGIDYEEGLEDKEAKAKAKKEAEYLKSKVRISKIKKDGKPMLEEVPAVDEAVEKASLVEEPERGLMARRK